MPIISDEKAESPTTHRIVERLKSLFGDATMIEITTFDEALAEDVLKAWLDRDRRSLTSSQWKLLQAKLEPSAYGSASESTPLFLSLLYEMTLAWHSFDDTPDPSFLKIKNTNDAIEYLYAQLSNKHGKILFERTIAYLRQAGGLSEIELEDMLSADDEVLQSIFVHYLPPLNIFRLPSTLWVRIRNDMQKYFVETNVDNMTVIYL